MKGAYVQTTDTMLRRTFLMLLLSAILVSGCRSYGGYGSEEATVAEIRKAVEWAGEERVRLSSDEMALRDASERLPFLEDFAPRLSELSAELTASIDSWSTRATGVDATSAYRTLNRELGSVVSERQRYEDRYRRLVQDLVAALGGGFDGPRPGSRYQVAPAHYERLASRRENRRIREVLTSTG